MYTIYFCVHIIALPRLIFSQVKMSLFLSVAARRVPETSTEWLAEHSNGIHFPFANIMQVGSMWSQSQSHHIVNVSI